MRHEETDGKIFKRLLAKVTGAGFLREKRETWRVPVTKKHIVFPLVTLVYLTFLIASLMVTPTTAYFTESVTIDGKITVDIPMEEDDDSGDEDVDEPSEEEGEGEKAEGQSEEKAKQDSLEEQDSVEKEQKDKDKSEQETDKEDRSQEETNPAKDTVQPESAEDKADSQGEDTDENE